MAHARAVRQVSTVVPGIDLMFPRLLLITSLVAALCLAESAAQERPNIVLFLVDDMGWQDTSVPFWDKTTLSNRHFRTPNMERLARQGRRFTNAHAFPVCTPTRVAIMTGQNPARHGTTNWTLRVDKENSGTTPRLQAPKSWKREGLQPDFETLPQILRDQLGYRTIHAGKAHWGAIDTPGAGPLQLGFDVNIAGHAAGGPGHYHGTKNYGNSKDGPWGVPGLEAYHGTETHLTEATTIETNKAVEAAVKEGKPFYLYLAHYAVHTPIQPHQRHVPNYASKNYPGTEIPIPQAEVNYASMIEGMDASLGAVLAKIEDLGVAEDTVVLFASDNGGLSYHSRDTTPRGTGRDTQCWPLREGKGSAYDGGTRIPMIISWAKPNAENAHQKRLPIAPNSKTNTPVIVEDFFPTLLNWAGKPKLYPTFKDRDGIDLTPVLLAEGNFPTNRTLIFHYPHQWTGKPRGGYQPHSSIRLGPWKAIYFYEGQSWELYKIDEDIEETKDLSKQHPEQLATLSKKLLDYLTSVSAHWPVNKETELPEQLKLPSDQS